MVLLFRGLKRAWRNSCNRNRVEVADEINPTFEDYLDYELHKEPLADFTLSEYTEKGTSLQLNTHLARQ